MKNIFDLTDGELIQYIDNRYKDSASLWSIIKEVTEKNKAAYSNNPSWLKNLPTKRSRVRDNRIFVNTEAVINALIANLPKPMITPGRNTPESKDLAARQEKFFKKKYLDRNVKQVIRKGLRNLYFSRLVVLKPFWDYTINDFNIVAVDPTKVRFAKTSTKEDNSDFAIEDVDDTVAGLITRFPEKREQILKEVGLDADDANIQRESVVYQEAWCEEYVIYRFNNLILDKKPNPYWDWDGVPITKEESKSLERDDMTPALQKSILDDANMRNYRIGEGEGNAEESIKEATYMYNYFDKPRKPYIFATVFDSENKPIGDTDIISQAIPLQDDIDETKRNITENARIMNGIVKVDAGVMDQGTANRLRWETGGIIWGKGVKEGVTRETGSPLPNFVLENLHDSRAEIDDIMAASSAFRGVREGQETRGGRLALIDQSFLRLNEFVQVVDYLNNEIFAWFYQLAKVFYTEHHYAKYMGPDGAVETLTLMRNDFEQGSSISVMAGKTLPEDRQYKYEQAQEDFKNGVLSPVDYLEAAGYDDPMSKAKNLVVWNMNKPYAVGISSEEQNQITPPTPPQPEMPKIDIKYAELPLDGKIQAAALAGIKLDPRIVAAEHLHEITSKRKLDDAKIEEMRTPKPAPNPSPSKT